MSDVGKEARLRLGFLESNTSGTGRMFLRQARVRGADPVLLCSDPERYPFAREENARVVVVDTSDERLVAEASERAGLCGITSSSDHFVADAARIANRYGWPGPDPDAVDVCRDKGRQVAVLEGAGLPVPRSWVWATAEDRHVALSDVAPRGYLTEPVVAKPISGSGSFNVRLCRTLDALIAHTDHLLERPMNERGMPVPSGALVQRYIDGPEFSVEIFDGQAVGVTTKRLGKTPAFVECGHEYPADLAPSARAEIVAVAIASVEALGICYGPAHVEMRLTDAGSVLIEVNPRLAGGFIPELIVRAQGINLIDATVARAMAQVPMLHPTCSRAAAIRFILATHAGSIQRITCPEAPEGAEVTLYRCVGDAVAVHRDFRDRLGHVIAEAPTSAIAARLADAVLGGVIVDVPHTDSGP